MAKMKFGFKVRPPAMSLVMWAIFIFLILQVLANFGFVNLAGSPIFFSTVIGLFLLLDQGVISLKTGLRRPKSFLGWTLTIFGGLILLGVAVSVLGFSVGTTFGTLISTVEGLTAVALLVSLVTE